MTTTQHFTDTATIQQLFDAQVANQYHVANRSAKERIAKLKQLKVAIMTTYRQAIRDALYNDFRKSSADVDLTEVFPVIAELKHTIKSLPDWMRKQGVSTPLTLIGSSSYIHYEPKGVCLIISPWNFPLNLTMGPLISAIAAGNTVILKPSEHTPHIAAVMQKIISDIFPPEEVVLITGGVETSTTLLALPFNHIFFTGAPAIGKVVMEAAAKNLTSVTLELGGKSPTIIDTSANINTAAKRIAWGKFLNSGQICIAPDYVFVHHSQKDAFVKALQEHIFHFYTDKAAQSPDYTGIVNQNHAKRIVSYLQDAINKGAKVAIGGTHDTANTFIAPTVVTNVSKDSALMQNEIFGPILPILTYTNLDEVVQYINAGEKPLALYIYSTDSKHTNYILKNTRAGGTCINSNDIHYFNSNLPFGGSNNSGIGKAHGYFGFQEFSNARGVYKQVIPGAMEFLMPPYNDLKRKLIEWAIKFF